MTAAAFDPPSLERYAELARHTVGERAALAVCDLESKLVWTSDDSCRPELERAMAELSSVGIEGDIPEARVVTADLEGWGRLLGAPISAERFGLVGWLVLRVPDPPAGSAAVSHERLARILITLATCIGNEYRLSHEVTDLSHELSERYEELNLVYSLEKHAASFDGGTRGIRAMLQTFADNLELDLVALLSSSRRSLHAVNPSQPIPDLDLILTQLRSDLLRFALTRKAAVVLNRGDDSRRRYLLPNAPYHVLACPVDLGQARAALALLRHADRPPFTNGDRNLAQVIAGQTAILMRNHTMLHKLEKFGTQMAGALIEAVEAKDPYTRGHSERVQQISTQLGRALGMKDPQLEGVFWGALLHDVGKIAIPDAILTKPCRLEEEEWDFVKQHPERSYEILRGIEYLSAGALDGARYHQERFDGTGYPHGLKGDEIPYPARLISVADAYDAITSSRSYRPALTHEVALERIRRAAGSQLDPRIVEAFDRLCGTDPRWLIEISLRRDGTDE